MKIIQMTDIHLTTPGTTIRGRDPNANFERALAHAHEQHPDAAALVITGDLSDRGERSDYDRLKERLDRLPLPVHLAIGNHDDRTAFLQVFPELADEDGHVQKTFELGCGTGIILDSWGPASHAGFFCTTRCAWLRKTLAAIDGPAYLFVHHHPIPTHLRPMDRIMLQDADAFGAVVADFGNTIAHIFFGHCHLPLAGSFHGVPVSAPRGTNHAGFANFRESEQLFTSDLPEAYAVIIVSGPSVTVLMHEYGYRGDVRVEGSPDYANREKTSADR